VTTNLETQIKLTTNLSLQTYYMLYVAASVPHSLC
jgi:hypothetical protein